MASITKRKWLKVGLVFVLSFFLLFPWQVWAINSVPTAPANVENNGTPNIVLILTDDQRTDTLWAMPVVQSELVAKGISFSNGFVVNSLCCPSRSSILTGQYSHSTGVYRNHPPYGGFESFSDKSTIATWLQKAGYTTAFIGKYLNNYVGPYVPPGWDHWAAFNGLPAYQNYALSVNGELERYGRDESDYSTDVLTDKTVSFIMQTKGPIFVHYAPYAPHVPYYPAPRHRDAFSDLPIYDPPSFNEEDVSDKPQWVRNLKEVNRDGVESTRKNQYRTLLAVDEGVERIIGALKQTGRLENTIIVFMSDNGYSWGEHRWFASKHAAYDEDIGVPYVVRYDALIANPGKESNKIVLNIDLAPTFADLAGVEAPNVDGKSFASILRGDEYPWRTDFLIEHLKDNQRAVFGGRRGPPAKIPTYCAVRKIDEFQNLSYVMYKSDEEELYDIANDPYQLDNLASNVDYQSTLEQMRTRTMELCNPLPPRFNE